jgi:hypothetical protein
VVRKAIAELLDDHTDDWCLHWPENLAN